MHHLFYHIIIFLLGLLTQAPVSSLSKELLTDVTDTKLNQDTLDSLILQEQQYSIIDRYNLSLLLFQNGANEKSEEVLAKIHSYSSTRLDKPRSLLSAQLHLEKKDTARAIQSLASSIKQGVKDYEILSNFEMLKRKFKNSKPPQQENPQTQSEVQMEGIKVEESELKQEELDAENLPKLSKKNALNLLETLKNNEIFIKPKTSESPESSAFYGNL